MTRTFTALEERSCHRFTPALRREGGHHAPVALAALILALGPIAAQANPMTPQTAIPPLVWGLVGFSEMNGVPVTIADPSRYTVQFLPEGRLLARFDCNQGNGGYTAADGVLGPDADGGHHGDVPAGLVCHYVPALAGPGHGLPDRPGGGDLWLRGQAGVLQLRPL